MMRIQRLLAGNESDILNLPRESTEMEISLLQTGVYTCKVGSSWKKSIPSVCVTLLRSVRGQHLCLEDLRQGPSSA